MPTEGNRATEVRQKERIAIRPGMEVTDLPTPALLMDLDGMESNLLRMANFFRASRLEAAPSLQSPSSVFAGQKADRNRRHRRNLRTPGSG